MKVVMVCAEGGAGSDDMVSLCSGNNVIVRWENIIKSKKE